VSAAEAVLQGTGEPVLSVQRLVKRFGGLTAVNEVSLEVEHGEILGLVGPNGAGKSVLINLVAGIYPPSSGTIRLGGRDISRAPSYARARLGIGRTYQNIRLLRRMTVLENVLAAAREHALHPLRAAFARPGRSDVAGALALLDQVHLAEKADHLSGSLAYGEARRLEIVRALMGRPSLLLLDEPAAGMNEEETAELARTVRFCRSRVDAVVIVEHDMAFMQDLSDRMVVMDVGSKIAEGLPRAVLADRRVIEAYLGVEEEGDD